MSKKNKIVVTGTGVVTALGYDTGTLWNALLAKKSAVKRITFPDVDIEQYGSRVGAPVESFNIQDFFENDKGLKRYGRVTTFALAGTKGALEDAGYAFTMNKADTGRIKYEINAPNLDRWGVIIGAGVQNMDICEKFYKLHVQHGGPKKISPFALPFIPTNCIPAAVSERFGTTGPSFALSTACASGTHGILTALWMLENGVIDVAITGGVDACMTSYVFGGFDAMNATSRNNDDPDVASRPFDKNRDGFVMGEGAGILILETEEHAKRRDARILARVAGGAMTSDAFHITIPDPQGQSAISMVNTALEQSQTSKDEIGYINAHGTSTPINDPTESYVIKQVFGDRAYKIPISSTKSMLGHSIGASGGIEAIVGIQTIRTNTIHPTRNLVNPDVDYVDPKFPDLDKRCDLDYVPGEPRKQTVDVVLSESFGFGGHNSAVILKRYE